MLARAAVLPFLAVAIAATGGAAQRPAEKNYTCQAGCSACLPARLPACVQSARGLPYKECELACAPPPGNFTCQSGKCVKSARGLPLAECSKICEAPGPGGKTIVDIALATPDLSTLVTALKAGGLVDTLSNQGPFTVFAPKNEAFAALPAGVVAKLLKPENKRQLDDVLTFHVVAGAVHAKDLRDGEKLKTLEGKELTVRLAGSTVFINSAKVTTADVSASNGVIHIIDEVLLPAGPAPPPGPPGPPPPPPPGPPGPGPPAPGPGPPVACPSGGYCGGCPAGFSNWDSIHLLLGNGSPGLKQLHTSVDEAVAIFRRYPGIRSDDASDTHMSVQYLCCLNSTQMATVRKVVATHPFPKLRALFGDVICRTASFIATVDSDTQQTLGKWVDTIENAMIAAGVPVHTRRSQQAPFHVTLATFGASYENSSAVAMAEVNSLFAFSSGMFLTE
jgi:uncharacterized surface protein with fasciclin (FAS1) repeats